MSSIAIQRRWDRSEMRNSMTRELRSAKRIKLLKLRFKAWMDLKIWLIFSLFFWSLLSTSIMQVASRPDLDQQPMDKQASKDVSFKWMVELQAWAIRWATTIINRMVVKVMWTTEPTTKDLIVITCKTWTRWAINQTRWWARETTLRTMQDKHISQPLLMLSATVWLMVWQFTKKWCLKYPKCWTKLKVRSLHPLILSTPMSTIQTLTSMRSSSCSFLKSLKPLRKMRRRTSLATRSTSTLKNLLVIRKLPRSQECSSICQRLSWTTPSLNGSTSSRKWCLLFNWSLSQIPMLVRATPKLLKL